MIPQLTKKFMTALATQDSIIRKNVGNLIIDVYPAVFPPESPFSESSHTLYDALPDLEGKLVLDIGTGTGIQAILAATRGARHVDAVDISPQALSCAEHNTALNGYANRIAVFYSNMFTNVPRQQYDFIIANLPILDEPMDDVAFHSLFDPGFSYHEQLFAEARNYLTAYGGIMLCHADLKGANDFKRLEKLAEQYGFTSQVTHTCTNLGYEWRNYYFTLKESF